MKKEFTVTLIILGLLGLVGVVELGVIPLLFMEDKAYLAMYQGDQLPIGILFYCLGKLFIFCWKVLGIFMAIPIIAVICVPFTKSKKTPKKEEATQNKTEDTPLTEKKCDGRSPLTEEETPQVHNTDKEETHG